MPVNKNAYERYMILDRCFSNFQKEYSFEDLINVLSVEMYDRQNGISERQLRNDIRFMREGFHAPIETYYMGSDSLKGGRSRKMYYRYTDEGYSISKQPISKAEAQSLQEAISTLARFRGLSQYDWIEDVITNLEHRFNLNGHSKGIVYFEYVPDLKGVEHLGTIINAATSHKVLKIEYRNYKNGGHEMIFIFHPYIVKQYNNRWFSFGYGINRDNNWEGISNLALDRIERIEPVDNVQFKPNNDIDFEHYFDDVIGVSINNNVEKQKIILQTNERRYPYIASKPLHPSQRIEDRKTHKISIIVRPNLELEQKILSFGPDIEVLEPASLRAEIKKKVEEMYKKYFPVQEERSETV